jgi:hypothetical protein
MPHVLLLNQPPHAPALQDHVLLQEMHMHWEQIICLGFLFPSAAVNPVYVTTPASWVAVWRLTPTQAASANRQG